MSGIVEERTVIIDATDSIRVFVISVDIAPNAWDAVSCIVISIAPLWKIAREAIEGCEEDVFGLIGDTCRKISIKVVVREVAVLFEAIVLSVSRWKEILNE